MVACAGAPRGCGASRSRRAIDATRRRLRAAARERRVLREELARDDLDERDERARDREADGVRAEPGPRVHAVDLARHDLAPGVERRRARAEQKPRGVQHPRVAQDAGDEEGVEGALPPADDGQDGPLPKHTNARPAARAGALAAPLSAAAWAFLAGVVELLRAARDGPVSRRDVEAAHAINGRDYFTQVVIRARPGALSPQLRAAGRGQASLSPPYKRARRTPSPRTHQYRTAPLRRRRHSCKNGQAPQRGRPDLQGRVRATGSQAYARRRRLPEREQRRPRLRR